MIRLASIVAFLLVMAFSASIAAAETPPEGFHAIFDGESLDGWHARPHFSPIELAAMPESERQAKLDEWMADAKVHWTVQDGELVNDGSGAYLVTNKDYRDYELMIDYKTVPRRRQRNLFEGQSAGSNLGLHRPEKV